jgi:hypothetical protein
MKHADAVIHAEVTGFRPAGINSAISHAAGFLLLFPPPWL